MSISWVLGSLLIINTRFIVVTLVSCGCIGGNKFWNMVTSNFSCGSASLSLVRNPFITNNGGARNSAESFPTDLGCFKIRLTSFINEYRLILNWRVGPRGILPILNEMLPESCAWLKMKTSRTPKGPAITMKSLSLFSFLSLKLMAVCGSITWRKSLTNWPREPLLSDDPSRMTIDLGIFANSSSDTFLCVLVFCLLFAMIQKIPSHRFGKTTFSMSTSANKITKKRSTAIDTKALAEKIKRNAMKKQLAAKADEKPPVSEPKSEEPEGFEVVDPNTVRFETFAELNLIPDLLESIQQMKFTKPTPIQSEAIPHALEGKDIIGLAQTGSGKTAAFAIPILQALWHAQTPYFGLVLAPTRELAFQIKETFDALGSLMGLRSVCVVGGMDMMDQARDLMRKSHIVVATPGRIMDHLEHTKGFSLKNLKYLVMDEADRLLDMDFGPALDKILKVIPSERTTYLFSATMTNKIAKLQRASLKNPVRVAVSTKYQTADNLVQSMMLVSDGYKNTILVHLLNEYVGKSTIVFTRTVAHAQRTALLTRILGFSSVPLHGQLSQAQRLGSLNKFKSGSANILIATDVAARGLDIPSVDLVVNYDIPTDSKAYIHRVGRTARAGKSGKSISLVTQYDLELYLRIENVLGKKLPKDPSPSKDVLDTLHVHVDRATAEAIRQVKEIHDKRGRRRGDDREEN